MTVRTLPARARRTAAVLAVSFVAALPITVAVAPAAQAHTRAPSGTRSLAAVLAADGSGFDRNPYDYDILDNAVTAVLKAKPQSPVAVLADGSVPLTAFLPNDKAFRLLAQDLTKKHYSSEQAVFGALASTLGIDTIEAVLLYHVVPGQTINYRTALKANGATLTTALPGSTLKVKVVCHYLVRLVDADPDARNALVVQADINRGNVQIAHGVSRVLRPVDL